MKIFKTKTYCVTYTAGADHFGGRYILAADHFSGRYILSNAWLLKMIENGTASIQKV